MINSKKKGNIWENKLSNWLRDNGVKAWKDGASGGGSREKGDVGNNIDFTLESKAGKVIKLMEWWRQVEHAASLHRNSPALFIHQDGMRDKEWLVVIHSEDWLDLIKSGGRMPLEPQNTPEIASLTTNEARTIKYEIQRNLTQLKALIKVLEQVYE